MHTQSVLKNDFDDRISSYYKNILLLFIDVVLYIS